MIADKCSRHSEHGRNDGAQDHRPCHCKGNLTDRERHAASSNADKRRAESARAAVECHHAGADGDKKLQGLHCERADKPAEQANAGDVEEKSKGEHGGGSVCKV